MNQPGPEAAIGTETSTFLTSLDLNNFRAFEEQHFTFATRLTVVFGKNGTGKSSVVDALATVLLAQIANARIDIKPAVWVGDSDTRRIPKNIGDRTVYEPAPFRRLQVSGQFWMGRVVDIDIDTRKKSTFDEDYSIVGRTIRQALESSEGENLPLFAVFRAQRRYDNEHEDLSNNPAGREDGYRYCLDVARSRDGLTSWFKRQLLKRGRQGTPSPEAEVVVAALRQAVPNLVSMEYDADLADLVVDFGLGEVPFGSLSDGQRGFFAMIAEIAIRCTQLNPHLNGQAATQTQGLVLIDEIDLHLHPEWQRKVVRALVETFVNVQFVVTTHSPIVLTEVDSKSIIDLDRPEADFVPKLSSFGKDSGWVTRYVMNAATRPNWASEAFEKLESAIDQGANEEARSLIRSLRQQLGDDLDPELVEWEAFVGGAPS
jgi:predicted ATP-binding protein involved in virulence